MTKRSIYIIYSLLLLLIFASCADESEVQAERDVDYCLRAAWQNGLAADHATRALSATSILADGKGDIVIDYADYPASIEVICTENDSYDLTLTKGSSLCSSHTGYWNYTPSLALTDKVITRNKLHFTASASIDEEDDELTGDFDYSDIRDGHMLVSLRHTKALLRFAFRVNEKYDKVRNILVTGIELNGNPCTIVNKVLNKTDVQFIAYAYIDPVIVDTCFSNSLVCTYNIYDEDAAFTTIAGGAPAAGDVVTPESIEANASHLTREAIKAKNQFTLGSLMDAGNNLVSKIAPGYYYDLRITLNPDYLYVLSDHDESHMTIN